MFGPECKYCWNNTCMVEWKFNPNSSVFEIDQNMLSRWMLPPSPHGGSIHSNWNSAGCGTGLTLLTRVSSEAGLTHTLTRHRVAAQPALLALTLIDAALSPETRLTHWTGMEQIKEDYSTEQNLTKEWHIVDLEEQEIVLTCFTVGTSFARWTDAQTGLWFTCSIRLAGTAH